MQIPRNKEVQDFIDKTGFQDFDKMESLKIMREIVFDNFPNTEEKIMYGGIMFFLGKEDFGELFVRKNHISFEFVKGFLMNDPEKLLEGNGKYRRHLKIKTIDDIKNKDVEFYVKQAI